MHRVYGCLLGVAACGIVACGFDAPGNGLVDGSIGDATPIDGPSTDAVPVPGCAPVDLRANASHTCLLRADGDISCWGSNASGQLGVLPTEACSGSTVNCNPTPATVPLPNGLGATAIGLGDRTGCASTGAGGTFCWGDNAQGELGIAIGPSPETPLLPTPIPGRVGARAFAGGDEHLCSSQGAMLKCAGTNSEAEIGDGTTVPRLIPTETNLSAASLLLYSAGYRHGCAVLNDGQLYCWGDNAEGQTRGGTDPTLLPTRVSLPNFVRDVAAAELHTCALLADSNGTVRCWGDNQESGQLGIASRDETTTIADPGLSDITSIRAGAQHTCALSATGAVLCWGEQYPNRPTLVDLQGAKATAIASGARHDCAIFEDRSVRCWGANDVGQLGDGAFGDMLAITPVTAYTCPP